MSPPQKYVETLAELSASGRPFVSVALVEATGSTPADAGAKMLVDANGLVQGTVGGGRVENQAIAHAQAMLQAGAASPSNLVEWNLQRDVGMTCGGVVKLFFEPYNLHDWKVVVFGAGHVAQSLVRCLALLECRVTCVDAREDWLAKLPTSPKVHACRQEYAEYVAQLTGDEYLVCMTMGHRTDRPVLEAIFRRHLGPPYLGVIGSAAKRKVLVRELTDAGFATEMVEAAFRCPIGLNLGNNQPGEIAVSVVAELIGVRDQVAAGRAAV